VISSGVPPASHPSTFHLLLVEDELADAELFIELLGEISTEFQVHHVLNGQSALDFVKRQGEHVSAPFPNLIVLDLNMPGMSGHEFLRRAKQEPQARSIPVLVLTTSDNPADVRAPTTSTRAATSSNRAASRSTAACSP